MPTNPPKGGGSGSTPNDFNASLARQIVEYGRRFLGVPYVWGGTSFSGVDCSGLVLLVYKHFGIKLPRTSQEQAKVGIPVARNKLQPGDILFYNTSSTDSHEAMYVGNGMQLEARTSGTNVSINKVRNFSHARRVIGATGLAEDPTLGGGTGGGVGGVGFPNPLNPADILKGLASALGVPDVKDLFMRLGLILLGAGIVIVGIFMMTHGGGGKKVVKQAPAPEPEGSAGEGQSSDAVQRRQQPSVTEQEVPA